MNDTAPIDFNVIPAPVHLRIFIAYRMTDGEVKTQGPFKSISKTERQARELLKQARTDAKLEIEGVWILCRA